MKNKVKSITNVKYWLINKNISFKNIYICKPYLFVKH